MNKATINITIPLEVSFEDNGLIRNYSVPTVREFDKHIPRFVPASLRKKAPCKSCKGSGSDTSVFPIEGCADCDGSGDAKETK